jgi:hypothetical protein
MNSQRFNSNIMKVQPVATGLTNGQPNFSTIPASDLKYGR